MYATLSLQEEAELRAYYDRMNHQKDVEQRNQREQLRQIETVAAAPTTRVSENGAYAGGPGNVPRPRRAARKIIDADWLPPPNPPPGQQDVRRSTRGMAHGGDGHGQGVEDEDVQGLVPGLPKYGRRSTHDAGG